jgi:hypothetical protein
VCGKPISPFARRCPHCQALLRGVKAIERPEKQISEDGGEAWNEAAERVAEFGALEWTGEVHPVNEDTHFIASDIPPPPLTPYAPEPLSAGRRTWLWGLGAGVVVLGLMLGGIAFVQRQPAATTSSTLAAQATLLASQMGGTPTPGGKDGITPQPTSGTGSQTPQPAQTTTPTTLPTATVTPLPTATPQPTATPTPQLIYAINAGGGAVGNFVADTLFSGGSTYGNSSVQVNTSNVVNPAPQQVYDSERYGVFTYTLPQLQPGAAYTVRLHFAEIYFKTTQSRVFNVSINGQLVLDNFDIVAAAGGPGIAIVKTFTAIANPTGQIVIAFTSGPENWAKLSGLEVYTLPR